MADDRPVGGSTRRVDTIAKLTGQARYAEDILPPGLLHARTVRCPHPHARLLALNAERALAIPGMLRVITAADIPGVNGFPEYSKDEPLLVPVGEVAKMIGAPVAFVVAETRDAAEAGVRAVEAIWERLPHTYDMDAALRPDALAIYPDGSVLSTFSVKHGDLEAAFAAADVMLETEYLTAFMEHSALEREAALGYIDEEGRITVICGTHEPHWQQNWIAAALALGAEQVRVIVPPTGGSFGG
jgi:CO/xanthine dehydrogenase Mo-binding subunit